MHELNLIMYITHILFNQFRSEQDKKNLCFICNIASHEFERRANGFDHHIQNDHNMWEYIYLSIYLDQIDISDHNAIQKYVYDTVSWLYVQSMYTIFHKTYDIIHVSQISKEKHDFFPLFHALALEKEEDKQAKQLDDIKTMVEKILKRFEEEVRNCRYYHQP